MNDYAKIIKNIRSSLSYYITENNIKSLVIGVSGGIDSAVCCALASPVCKKNNIPLIGRSLTIESNKSDEISRSIKTGEAFCTDFFEYNLTPTYMTIRDTIEIMESNFPDEDEKEIKIRSGNIKSRLRMIYLFHLAKLHKGMVLSTDNLTEYRLGFFTLNGDVGNYGMIQNLIKTEIYEMTDYLISICTIIPEKAILEETKEATPTDGLGISNSDLDQIMPDWKTKFNNCRDAYKAVDIILEDYFTLQQYVDEFGIVKKEMEEKCKHPVIQRYLKSDFKRKNPINLTREYLMFG